MKRFRKGNDIDITWELDNPAEVDLSNADVYLYDSRHNKCEATFEIEDDVVTGVFLGKDQKTLGVYRLLLIVNDGESGMVTLDKVTAFCLTGVCDFGTVDDGDDEDGIETAVVSLSSTLGTPSVYLTKAAFEEWLEEYEAWKESEEGSVSGLITALASEVSARESGDTTLQTNIDTLDGKVVHLAGTEEITGTKKFLNHLQVDFEDLEDLANDNRSLGEYLRDITIVTGTLDLTNMAVTLDDDFDFTTIKGRIDDGRLVVFNLSGYIFANTCTQTSDNVNYILSSIAFGATAYAFSVDEEGTTSLSQGIMTPYGVFTTHTSDSTVHITSAERRTWNAKQDALTFDDAPALNSLNPVTSHGIYGALQDYVLTNNLKILVLEGVAGSSLTLNYPWETARAAAAAGKLLVVVVDDGTVLIEQGYETSNGDVSAIYIAGIYLSSSSSRSNSQVLCKLTSGSGSTIETAYLSPPAFLDKANYTSYVYTKSEVAAIQAALEAADTTLQTNIDSEASARAAADTTLQTNIDSEASARAAADTTLQTNIDSEASTRASADTTLQSNIDSEASARAAADTTLQTNIDSEASARAAADTTLQSNIDAQEGCIFAGALDATSTSTVMTATISGFPSTLRNGLAVWLTNGVITSASGVTLNINSTGALPIYQSQAVASAITTQFNKSYTVLLVYNSTRVSGGCWDFVYGYNTNDNTLAYQVRRNNGTYSPVAALYRYMICLSYSETQILPVSTTSNSTGTSKTLTTDEFDPFGPIFYYSTTTTVSAGGATNVSYMWDMYALDLRYSFNEGSTLTTNKDVYIRAVPQGNGRAKLASSPISQSLPTTEDGYIYILLGHAYSTSSIVLTLKHPVYEYYDGGLRLWTGDVDDATVAEVQAAFAV